MVPVERAVFFLWTVQGKMMQGARKMVGHARASARLRGGGAGDACQMMSGGAAAVYVPDPPPSYAEAVAATQPPFVPPRYRTPTEGRNSIVYSQLPPLYDTTRLYLVDNKSADIESLNYQSDHSDFVTSVVQNGDFTPQEAATQTINLDDRSRWGGELKTVLHTCLPNINGYLYSSSFSAKLMSKYDATTQEAEYTWYRLTIPEGNYPLHTVIDLMNEAIVQNYLSVGRQNGVKEDQIGVKIDTRNFRLGYDPETGLITPGTYTYEAMHPDVLLLPGCAISFTESRLSNLLGWRKRLPFQPGFVIEYDDLVGGNVPALLDVPKFQANPSQVVPVEKDSENRSYHVGEDKSAKATDTAYRSLFLAYNYGPGSDSPGDFNPAEQGAALGQTPTTRQKYLLTSSDVTCGAEQLYWSLPDLAEAPVTFRESAQSLSQLPVVATELLPLQARLAFNAQPAYSQAVNESMSTTKIFNRFPENQILMRPPAPSIVQVAENVPSVTSHGVLPLKNSLSGVQRVVVTDARRRTVPYVVKSLGVVAPQVLSSKTF